MCLVEMTCPNCGAEMERHAFTHVCPFCGSTCVAEGVASPPRFGQQQTTKFYEYIKRNISYIQNNNTIVYVKELYDGFEIISAQPFYPRKHDLSLDKTIAFWWYAKILKRGIDVQLLVQIKRTNTQNFISIKIQDEVIPLLNKGYLGEKLAFSMPYQDFDFLCKANEVTIDTNLWSCVHNNTYKDFVTYSRKFYNMVIDKEMYQYAILQIIN